MTVATKEVQEEQQMYDESLSAVSVAKKYSCEVLLEKTSYEHVLNC